MKPGQIRPLYLEPRLHLYKQSVKQEINNHETCLAKPLHTKQQQNVWQTIGPPSMRLLSDLPRICPLRSDEFQKLLFIIFLAQFTWSDSKYVTSFDSWLWNL
jgi:hypothetical protein